LQTREQFLSIASHELRTPLTSLLGYASLLPQAVARGTGQVDKMTDRIVRQAQRLNGLIDQLLDVSRLQRGQFVIARHPLDLAALVGQVVDEVRVTLPPTSPHTITLTASGGPVVIDGDVERLEQVLHNLLSNALKYSPQGGQVQVQVTHTATEALVDITDQGIGIPTDAQARLFEPFFRAPNVGGQASGFGLGLHIVREIVARHGGRVAVASTEGQGSTFRVVLPLHQADAARAAGAGGDAA
jgi:signal transduction histidine kinase